MKYLKTLHYFLLPAVLLLAACNSNEIANSKDVNPETVYMEYTVSYSAALDSVSCRAQYRFGGINGTTLVLNPPSKLELDGHVLTVDSAEYTGAFYARNIAASQFAGNHKWKFTSIDGKTYTTAFSFGPVVCKTELPAVIGKNDIDFEITGTSPRDSITIEISDTASGTPDIRRRQLITDSKLTVTVAELKQLTNGPLAISIYRNEDLPLTNATREGGHIVFNYEIKQYQVILKE